MAARSRVVLRVGAIALLASVAVATIVDPTARRSPGAGRLFASRRPHRSPRADDSASCGRRTMFVAEKSGRIMISARPGSAARRFLPSVAKRLRHVGSGRLALALDPAFPREPYVYVATLITLPSAGPLRSRPSRNGTDTCPIRRDPEGRLVSSGRLSVLTARGNHMVGKKRGLIEEWSSAVQHALGRRPSSSARTAPCT